MTRGPWLSVSARLLLILFVFLSSAAIASAATETVVHSFIPWANGAGPSQLIADAQGNLYGTTRNGGTYEGGTVFKLTFGSNRHWQESVLYSFGGRPTDGTLPWGGVTLDAAGNLYGTTFYGGAFQNGIVFELTPAANGRWRETILHSFGKAPDGANPYSSVTIDAAGNLYGTTSSGGSHNCGAILPCGTVFELSPASDGTWRETVLHSFKEKNSGGQYPIAGVVIDAAGNLYGTTTGGGAGTGSVFELSPSSKCWTFSVLHAFTGNSNFDGYDPNGGLTLDASGNIFGTTLGGGTQGAGTFFELQKSAGGVWKETILFNFIPNGSGIWPAATLIQDGAGNFYGTTLISSTLNTQGNGTVFELSPNGSGGWTQTTLYTTQGISGNMFPSGGVVFGPGGSLYGATGYGGAAQAGSIFALAPGSGGKWVESELYEFPSTDGANPAGLVSNGSGSFYGLTASGGSGLGSGIGCFYGYCGTAYQLSRTSNGSWQENVIHNFSGLGADGGSPTGSLILDSGGNLYGATAGGGLVSSGTAFRLSPSSGGGWTETTLHSFGTYTNDGVWPLGSLVSDAAGNLYGRTEYGGTNNCGVVYQLKPSTKGTWAESVIYNFTTLNTDYRGAGLVVDSSGNLYGVANEVVFKLSPGAKGKWTETDLYTFKGPPDGSQTDGSLTLDAAGNLYGTTEYGGAYNYGTVYELSPGAGGWSETILYSFGAFPGDGQTPLAGVVLDAAGNLCGTTMAGGTAPLPSCGYVNQPNCGTVFKLSPTSAGQWTETILHNFVGGPNDGQTPPMGVGLDSAGNIFGTTNTGGLGLVGVVYEITP
jgi:uncharacterized repeat protein (TIGR03803 family)